MCSCDDDEITIHTCYVCGGFNFYLVVGGALQCSNCGAYVDAFWIAEDGIKTGDIENANRNKT